MARSTANSLPIRMITILIIHAPHFLKETGVDMEEEPKVHSGLPEGPSCIGKSHGEVLTTKQGDILTGHGPGVTL